MTLETKYQELERVRKELEGEETLSLEKASLYGERLILLYSEIEILETIESLEKQTLEERRVFNSSPFPSDSNSNRLCEPMNLKSLEERIQLALQDLEDWKHVLTDEKATEKDKAQGYMCIQILEAEIQHLRSLQ